MKPRELIGRHVERLLKVTNRPEMIEMLLAGCGMRRNGDGVVELEAGGKLETDDCANYKRAVRDLFGEATFNFTRVNFILGGCACSLCRESQKP